MGVSQTLTAFEVIILWRERNAYIIIIIITARSKLRKVLFLVLSVTSFVCVWNIPGTTEEICAKFTGKTRLVLRSDKFECQGQSSKVKVTGDKKRHFYD